MSRSVVRLPSDVRSPFDVYVNGVRQQLGEDYHVHEGALVFERELRKDRISGWRWFLGAWGIVGPFAILLLRALAQGPFRRRCHSRDRRHILGSRPALIFVRATEINWFNRNSAAQKQKAGALGAVKFVRRKTSGID